MSAPTKKSKPPQKPWLRTTALRTPAPGSSQKPSTADVAKRLSLPRLLSRQETCALVGCAYATLWDMMRRGEFPRSRIVGGKSKWLSTDIEQWLAALPRRRLKGDPDETVTK